MLEYIWFIFFVVISICSAAFFHERMNYVDDSENAVAWLFISAFCLLLGGYISWNRIGDPYLSMILKVMPDQGTAIAQGTALFLLIASGVALFVLILVVAYYINEYLSTRIRILE